MMPPTSQPLDDWSLNSILRTVPFLGGGDSVYRAIEMLRDQSTDSLPVLDSRGRLRGSLSLSNLAPLLANGAGSELLAGPVEEWVQPADATCSSDATIVEARSALLASGRSTLFVIDDEGYYVGAATLADLLIPCPIPPRPAPIGGMATPWGVYLTNGSIQAGVGNWALLGSGVLLGLLIASSYLLIGGLAWAIQARIGWPLHNLWVAPPPAQITVGNLGWFVLQALPFPAFLLLMRAMPLAGYHAAEHQVVHAMERSEPLIAEVVAHMPRVHPRCGTNLVAGLLVFGTVSKVFMALPLGMGSSDSAAIGGVAALLTWRSVGAVLQQYFTTRRANERQIASGIAAAADLQNKYLTTVLRRPNLFRRLWCMGFPQMAVGSGVASFALLGIFYLLGWQ